MRFEVQQADLIKALTALSRIIVKVQRDSILQNVLIKKIDDNKIRLIASNMTTSLRFDVDAQNVDIEEDVLYNLNLLTAIINKTKDTIIFNENYIKTKDSKYKISYVNAKEFPEIQFDHEEGIELECENLKTAINKTAYAASDVQGVLSGIYFNGTEVVAIDGKRLALSKINSELDNFILSKSASYELVKLFNKDTLKVSIKNQTVYFYNDSITFKTNLIAGKYPDYKGLLPRELKYTIKFNKNDLLNAIDILTPVMDAKMMLCSLMIDKNIMTITAINKEEVGTTSINIESNLESNKVLKFNAKYLIEMLNNFENEVEMKINDSYATVFEDGENYSMVMQIT